MATRLFKTLNSDESHDQIFAIEVSEISVKYNLFGFYYEDLNFEENLELYREQRNEEIQDELSVKVSYTLNEVKELISEFQDNFYYDCSRYNNYSARPKKFLECTDEELFTSFDGFYFDELGKEAVTEENIPDICKYEYTEFWDGSNMGEFDLTGAGVSENVEEITEDFLESFENKTEIGSNWKHGKTRWSEYHYDEKTGTLFEHHLSQWQGEKDSWELLEGDEYIDKIFVMCADDEAIDRLRPHMREKYGNELIVVEDAEELHYNEYKYFSLTYLTIVSKEKMEYVDCWIDDPYRRIHGIDYYKLNDGRIIAYSWSAYQDVQSRYLWSDEETMKAKFINQ